MLYHEHIQGCQLSRIERDSHAWALFLTLSRQACKISHINAKRPAKLVKSHKSRKRLAYKLFFFFFCSSLFLKVKTDAQFDERTRKRTAKYFFFFFGFSRQAILKSWQSWHITINTQKAWPDECYLLLKSSSLFYFKTFKMWSLDFWPGFCVLAYLFIYYFYASLPTSSKYRWLKKCKDKKNNFFSIHKLYSIE